MSQRLRPLLPLLPALAALLAGTLAGGIDGHGGLLALGYGLWLLGGERRLPGCLWLAGSLGGGLALAAHLLPGFTPLILSEARAFSPDAAPYAVRLHWDKLLLGTLLLAWWWRRPVPPPLAGRAAGIVAVLTLLAVPALALALGVVAWQPKWPPELGLWLAVNLGVTALAEELLLRGLLQGALVARLGAAGGIAVAAGLFGLAHLPFSAGFALAATLAGFGYGWVMHLSGRLAAAVLLHGAVNLLHLLLLSYPLRLP